MEETVTLSITLNMATGKADFTFPQNTVLALGMLEAARAWVDLNVLNPAFERRIAVVPSLHGPS